MAWMLRHEQAGGARHAAELPLAQGIERRRGIGAGLDLDESQDTAAPRDDVDFAELGAIAPRQDRIARQAQPPHRAPFGDMAQAMRALPCRGGHGGASRWASRLSARARA